MKHNRKKLQRAAAILGVVLLLSMYLAALICAFIDHPLANSILWSAVFCTIVIPVLIYLFCFCVKHFPEDSNHNPKEPHH